MWILAILVISIFIVTVCEKLKDMINCKYKQKTVPPMSSTIKPFSPSEYLERFEKANLDILKEREEWRNEYEPILWIGLKGLKFNKDGTTEWIKREIGKPAENEIYSDDIFKFTIPRKYNPVGNNINQGFEQVRQNINQDIANAEFAIRQQLQATDSQIRALQMQQAQQMCNAAAMPSYMSTFNNGMCNYTNAINNSCTINPARYVYTPTLTFKWE